MWESVFKKKWNEWRDCNITLCSFFFASVLNEHDRSAVHGRSCICTDLFWQKYFEIDFKWEDSLGIYKLTGFCEYLFMRVNRSCRARYYVNAHATRRISQLKWETCVGHQSDVCVENSKLWAKPDKQRFQSSLFESLWSVVETFPCFRLYHGSALLTVNIH